MDIIIWIAILGVLLALPPAIKSIKDLIDEWKTKGKQPEKEPPHQNVAQSPREECTIENDYPQYCIPFTP